MSSSLGLLAFARYNTMKRTREIGIRKTFGSDRGKILKLLHKESFIMVLIILLIAMATTFIQTSKASNMNPVDALRYE